MSEWYGLCKKHFKEAVDKDKDGWCKEKDLGECAHVNCYREAEYELYPKLGERLEENNKEDFVSLDETDNINCCFCNKRISFYISHDIRPIKSEKGDRCCTECNSNFVIPTRTEVW